MSEMKPTPGPWDVNHAGSASGGKPFTIDEFYVYAPSVKDDVAICSDVIDPITQKPNEANARLIAEAGTVFHETGLSPRQLVEMNAELLSVLLTIDTRLRICMDDPISASEAYDTFYQDLAKDIVTKASACSISKE